MLCIPKSNHKKLVDDCYPAPKALAATAPEYRPNSNELGRLCYYAQNKPAKLTKVGHLLAARSTVERNAMRSVPNDRVKAGLMLTIGILKELVASSPGGLTYLAPTVQTVLCESLQASAPGGGGHAAWDADISGRAAGTFAQYARALPTGALEIDESIPRSVYGVLDEMQVMVRGNVDEHTRLTGLGAMEGIVRSRVLYSSAFPDLLQRVLPGVLDTVSPAHYPLEHTAALADQDGDLAVPSAADKPADAESTTSAALILLRHIVQGADAVQIRTVIQQTLAWFDANGGQQWAHEEFAVWLLSLLALWTPRASRYAVPHTLVDVLSASSAKGSDLRATRLLQALHAILANKIEIVGLNMTDVLEGHIHFLLAHVQHNPGDPTVGATVDAIGHLVQYRVYADQLADFVQQINAHLVRVQSASPPLSPQQRDNSLRALLYCQMAIVRSAHADRAHALTPVPLLAWRSTESLLLSSDPAVRFTYLQALLVFLDLASDPQQALARGEASYAPDSDSLKFLHAFTADAYVVLSRETLSPGASLEAVAVGDGRFDVSQLRAVPADYAALLAVLEALYVVAPAPALLATVPALLALDRVAAAPRSDAAAQPACRAARWVVGLALAKLGAVWNVPALVSYVQAHILQPLGHVDLERPTLSAQFGAAPAFSRFDASPLTAGAQQPDVETVAEHLASSAPLQAATNCDSSTLRAWLLRNWTTSVAAQDAQIGAQPIGRVGATSPLRNLTRATSAARVPPTLLREGSMNVSQLRMALMNRAPSRGSALPEDEGDVSLGDARSTTSRSRRRRGSVSGGHVDTRPSVASLLDKYKVGGESYGASGAAYAAAPAAYAPEQSAYTSPAQGAYARAAPSAEARTTHAAASEAPAPYRAQPAEYAAPAVPAAPAAPLPASTGQLAPAVGGAAPLTDVEHQLTGLAPVLA